jgi:integrase
VEPRAAGGPVVRSREGKYYTSKGLENYVFKARASIDRAAEKQSRKPPFTRQTPYGYRHTFATDWLLAGKPTGHLCQLFDTSETKLRRHYSHLYAHTTAL